MMQKNKKSAYVFIPILFSLLISLMLYYAGWLTTIENHLHENESYLSRTQYNSDVVIIEIDHASLKTLKSWPWPRRYYAEVINNLSHAQAKKIFLDVDFSTTSNPEDDNMLASALSIAKPGSILMPSFLQYSDSGSNKYLTLNEPNEKFKQYVTSVSVNLNPDSDGLVRRIKILSSFADQSLPTAAIIFNNYNAKNDETIKLNLRITPESFQRISFHEIYNKNFNPELIKDKFIIIGATALELSDLIALPVYKSLPGPVIQAIAHQTLANGKLHLTNKTVTVLVLLLSCYPVWLLLPTPGWRKGLRRLILINLFILSTSVALHVGFNTLTDVSPLILFTVLSYIFLQLAKIDNQFHTILSQKISLNNKEKMMTHVISNTSEGIILLNTSLKIKSINTSACDIFGYTEIDLINKSINKILPGLNLKNAHNSNQFESEALHQSSKKTPVEITLDQLQTHNGFLYTIFIHDISERKQQQTDLNYQVSHDALTGLHSRTYLLSKVDDIIKQYNINKKPATLIMIDLNNFKSINDTLGHSTGDRLLKILGERLQTLQNEKTCVARLGGDEFSLLTTHFYTKFDLDLYIKNIHRLISKPINLSDMSLSIDAAIGLAFIPDHAKTKNEILIAADVAMYKSKSSGKNFCVYDPQTDYLTKRNLIISNDIKQALNKEQLYLTYQPKVNLHTNKVVSFEALIRWQHPELGLIRPDEFIPVVEKSSLIKPVTIFTIETAILKLKEFQQQELGISIAINLSAKLFDDKNLAADITNLLKKHGIAAEKLTLEITESAAMTSNDNTLATLNTLIKNNFKLSIDDFGTSYASFSYLKQLPASELKIDKLFITNICNDDSDKIITESIISLAHSLNMKVVAEGIEDQKTYDYLHGIGCDIAQGYWISKPMADEDVIDWINEWHSISNTHKRHAISN